MSKILHFLSKLNQMKFKILFELYMTIGVIFGQSINQVFFKGTTEVTWNVIFILGVVYTIWWFYYLFKNGDYKINVKKYLVDIFFKIFLKNKRLINVKVGDMFTATYKNKSQVVKLTGRIQIETGSVYLCQNEIIGGSCADKLGYEYSWYISSLINLNIESLKIEYIHNFKIVNRKSRISKLNL